MSNARRKDIKLRCNDLERRARPRAIQVPGEVDEPGVYCYAGQQLQSRGTSKKDGLFKHVLYIVQAVDAQERTLRMHPTRTTRRTSFSRRRGSGGGSGWPTRWST